METKTDRQERIPHFEQASIRNAKVMVVGAGASGNEVLKNSSVSGTFLWPTSMIFQPRISAGRCFSARMTWVNGKVQRRPNVFWK